MQTRTTIYVKRVASALNLAPEEADRAAAFACQILTNPKLSHEFTCLRLIAELAELNSLDLEVSASEHADLRKKLRYYSSQAGP